MEVYSEEVVQKQTKAQKKNFYWIWNKTNRLTSTFRKSWEYTNLLSVPFVKH